MIRKSFIDLTALLDVILILFFAALINMANGAEEVKSQAQAMEDQLVQAQEETRDIEARIFETELELQETLKMLVDYEEALANLYGSDIEDLQDHQDIISKISIIEVELKGSENGLIINGEATDIHIVRASMSTDDRLRILNKNIREALNTALDKREKSDIIFMKVRVLDREVYKFAYDYLIETIDQVIENYGRDKVLLSKEYD